MSVSDGRILGPKNPGSRAVPSGGKGDKSRYIRPVERQRMRPWLIDHLEKNDVPGLTWQNRNDHVFRISWKHAANQCFNMQNDTNLFERWAIHTGRHEESDHKRWKANFRCALNSLPDVIELKEYGIKKGSNAFKVYKFLDEKESRANKEHKAKMKRDPTSYGGYEYVQSRKYRSDSDHEETAEAVPSLPNLSSLYTPLSTVEMVVETDSRDDTQEVDMDNLQEILTAAQASLEAGIDAAALEKISIEQLSKMGDLSKMKLDIRSTGTESPIEPMYVFVCNWCEKVFPSKVELFQHFLTAHQERLLAHEEYQREGSSLQREIEDLEKKVLNFTREKYKSKDSGEVIEDGQVVDMSSTNIMTSQDVYIEDQALDLSMTQTPAVKQEEALDLTTEAVAGKHKMQLKASQPKLITKKRRSGALDMDYIKKFDDYGLAGRPQTKRQLSLVTKKKEEKEKSKKGGVKKSSDSSKQHSVEDLVHAEILISLKSGANEDEEEEMESDPETVTDVEDDAADKDGSVKSEKSATSSKSNTDADRKPVTCGICSNVFEDAAKLYAHVTEHKNEYKCGMCQTVYHTKDEYVKHLGTHVSTSESTQDAGKAAKTFTCSICEKTFSSAKLLESHKDEHYTVTPIRTSNKKVAMVVHPSTSLLTSKKDKTAASSESREDQKPAEAKEDAKVIVSSASKSDKVAKIVSSDGEEIYVLYSDIDDGTGQGDKKKGKTSDKAFDQDSVDGDKQTITKVGSNAKGSNISVKEKDGHLPAFSEIVKDVDEFFIKDVRSESESQSEKDLETDTDASKTETAASTSADTSENAPDISLEISPPSSQDPHGDSNYSDEEENRCVICMEELDSTQSLKEHMKLHSIFELTNAKCFEKALKGLKAGEVSDVHADSEKKSKLFICKLCHEEFEQFLDLKEHVSKHLEKPASGKAKRGRPPKRFLDKPESPKAKRHDSKLKQSNSVLAAALNTGPKFPIQTHFKNGKPKKHYLLNEKGDGTLKEGASLEKKFKDDSDHENVDVEKVEVLTKSTAVKKAANSDSVKATPVAITQNFASKLLVQGVTSFLNQKEKNIFFPNSTSIPTGTTASAPKSAQQPTLQVLTPTFLPNAGGAASAISIGGKVTPLHQLRFINTSDIKTAVSPQVIFLKQGSPLPVQLTSQLNALHQNTIAVSQVAGLQTTTIPASKLSTMVTLPIVSLPQQLIASTLTSAKPNLDPSVIAPTVKQMISTQKSVPQVLPTVVPVSMVKTLAQYAPQVTVVSTLKAVPSITTIPTLNLASLQPVRTTISDLSPKFTISLAALQGLATVDLKQKTVNIPVTTKGATYSVPTDTSLPTTRVNPQTQNNLLNMVLARMGQPGQVSVSRPSNQTTPETTASLPASVSLLSGTATLSSAPSVIESGVAASSTQLSPAAQGNVETPLKLSNENMHKSSGEFGKGVVLFSYICKGNLASLEELTSDSCSQATTTSSDTVTTVSTGALQTSPTCASDTSAIETVAMDTKTGDSESTHPSATTSSTNTGKKTWTGPSLRCPKCLFSCDQPTNMLTHMESFHGVKWHKCKYAKCSQSFDSELELELHYVVSHNYECKICFLRMKKFHIYEHSTSHCTVVIKSCVQCDKCKDVFLNIDLFKDHQEHCRDSKDFSMVSQMLIKCQGCTLHLKTMNIVLSHVKKSHIQRVTYSCAHCDCIFQHWTDVKTSIVEHIMSKHAAESSQIRFCHPCCLAFANEADFERHKLSSEHERVRQQQLVNESNTETDSVSTDGSMQEIRTVNMLTKSSLKLGILKSRRKPFLSRSLSCRDCHSTFRTVFQLRQHRVFRHGDVMKGRTMKASLSKADFTCELCSKSFMAKNSLNKHREKCILQAKQLSQTLIVSDEDCGKSKQDGNRPDIENS